MKAKCNYVTYRICENFVTEDQFSSRIMQFDLAASNPTSFT